MGRPKALLPIGAGRETFFDRITRTLLEAGVAPVAVVVGADAVPIRRSVRPADRVQLVDNPDFERGQLTSLLVGLRAIDRDDIHAAVVTLIDTPLVTVETVRTLIETHARRRSPIVRPVSQGRHGHPVIFDRSVFEELRRADPAEGAKTVVRAHAADILEVAVADEGAFIDIDTPEDYERWIGPLRD